ncbi:Protein CBG22457 [Caenorhabditis briggsae]|uniref:Protein CBG22457 n=1 Tax=Caenorhabditis briggsae TaxID=6238 RepID=A8Y2B9_CAEBR|nr:Protein CBG22457 [Caenorhabditis briggsae]CAP39040.2 Protein CBG22457 [Caenorhabditis briggsae]
MVLSKPLPYDCNRHIIMHMEPNLRILLSLRCPSLQAADKSVPFKCQKLEFKENETTIDEVDYKVGIHIHMANKNRITEHIANFNRSGGLNCDIDMVGRRDWLKLRDLYPGDVQLQPLREGQRADDPIFGDHQPFLQFTVKYQNEEYIERVEYTKSLIEAYIHINSLLFGGRSEPIRVKHLQLRADILRLPKAVKFHSKEVDARFTTANGFEKLKEIMKASSFPLNLCGVGYMSNDWSTFEHPVFRSARCVFIRNEENNQPELFRRLLELPHENITVQSRLSWRTFQTITENWRRTQRKVGTTLIIKRVHTKDVENVLNQILQEWQHRENKNEDFIVHLYQDKKLRISSGDTHEELPRNPRLWDNYRNFLKLEVIDVDNE